MKMKILKEVDEKQLTLIPKNKGLEVTKSRKERKQTNKHTYTHKYMIQIPSVLKAILLIEKEPIVQNKKKIDTFYVSTLFALNSL